MGFSIYDLLKEAEGDENQNTDTPADDTASADSPAETDDNDAGEDDNFNIDANLDDDTEDAGDTEGDQPADNGDDLGGGDLGGGSSGGNEDSEDEPVEDNTDIFASLTAEEQKIKIMELKSQYGALYNNCDELIDKFGEINVDEDSIGFVSRITTIVINLKKYIADYLTNTFADKSFIENDIMFNRFLSIIQSVSVSFDKFEKRYNADKKEPDENT